jgi:predicted thioredoxin/glutaredoxin
MGSAVEVEKVEDIKEIMKFRVLATPALAVDGVVKAAGRVLSPVEIKKLIAG